MCVTIFTHCGVELNLKHTRQSLYHWTAFPTSHPSLRCIPQISPHIHLSALLPWLPGLFKLGLQCQRGCYTFYGMICFHHLGKIQTLTEAWCYMKQIMSIYFQPLLLSIGSIPPCHMKAGTLVENQRKSEACCLPFQTSRLSSLPDYSSYFQEKNCVFFTHFVISWHIKGLSELDECLHAWMNVNTMLSFKEIPLGPQSNKIQICMQIFSKPIHFAMPSSSTSI